MKIVKSNRDGAQSRSRHLFVAVICLGLLAALSSGCATSPSEKKDIDMVWPLPPDEPKIKFVDVIYSVDDLGEKKGIAESLFGDEKADYFSKLYGVAVDSEGKIYMTDVGRVWVIDMKKKDYKFIGVEPGLGRVRFPIGVATSSDGRLFVADVSADRVFVYSNGKYVASIGHEGELNGPSGVAVDEKRNVVYVVDVKKHFVNVYSLKDYSKIRTLGTRGDNPGEFNYPTNIALDAEGNLYVVDTGNCRVQVFDPSGKYMRSIGKLGDNPGELARPKGIAIDSEGHIYVLDAAFNNFQIFDKEGRLLLAVGSAGAEPGKFLLPAGIAIDRDDKIYVINQAPASLQIFQYLGEKWKKARADAAGDKTSSAK